MKDQAIGVVGLGIVGAGLVRLFKQAQFPVVMHDAVKSIGSIVDVVSLADIVFVCVPSHWVEVVLKQLEHLKFTGAVVLKNSDLSELAQAYPFLNLVEFRTNAKKKVIEVRGLGPAPAFVVHAFKQALPETKVIRVNPEQMELPIER